MVVVILEKVPASVRGELTRWMIEMRTGVFVGNVSGMVRDKLWEMICSKVRKGAGMLVHNAASEQGFAIRFVGETSREVVDFDGLKLIQVTQNGGTTEVGQET